MKEVWKDIKGFEGLYQVSNLGRVKSLSRRVRGCQRWEKKASYVIPERIRTISKTRGDYLYVPLTKDRKHYPKRLNRLVAEAFVDGYSKDVDVHHIDGDRTNNRADNLECIPPQEHHKKHCHNKRAIGKKDGEIIILNSMSEAKHYGFDPANVGRCCKVATLPEGHPQRKKYATHKGFVWRYAE